MRIEKAPEIVLSQAAWSFRRSENVRQAISWYREHPDEFSKRVEQFDQAIGVLNASLGLRQPDRYRDVAALSDTLNDQTLPTLASVDHSIRSEIRPRQREAIVKTIQDTFLQISNFSGRWAWAEEIKQPKEYGKLASGLLVEGYGLLLANRFKNPQVARSFVLAFEGILFLNWLKAGKGQKSELLEDIFPWIIEDAKDFPEAIRSLIDQEKASLQQ